MNYSKTILKSSEICSICKENKANSCVWQCDHFFCRSCVEKWEGLCPICRKERTYSKKFDNTEQPTDWCCGLLGRRKINPVNHYTNQRNVTTDIYYGIWSKESCIEENHLIRFDHDSTHEIGNRGSTLVVGTCETCGQIQWFPYMQ